MCLVIVLDIPCLIPFGSWICARSALDRDAVWRVMRRASPRKGAQIEGIMATPGRCMHIHPDTVVSRVP